jgi:hypothetical protein
MRAHRHRVLRNAPVLLVVSLALVACGDKSNDATSTTTTRPPAATTSAPSTTSTTGAPAERTEVRAYFIRGEVVGPIARQVAGDATAAGAIDGLVAGPTPAERDIGFSTAIPAGTARHGLTVENGTATVDLSPEFASGGGSASMRARVAQVVFTLTQFPSIDAVAFKIDGQALTVLGGEGLLLQTPQRRTDWEDLSPAILVESPLPLTTVSRQLRITGTANTFEAVFRINVTDGEGRVVYDHNAMATSGTGTRGTFDVTAPLDAPRPGVGSVIVFEESAKDGTHIHVVKIPIHLST